MGSPDSKAFRNEELMLEWVRYISDKLFLRGKVIDELSIKSIIIEAFAEQEINPREHREFIAQIISRFLSNPFDDLV